MVALLPPRESRIGPACRFIQGIASTMLLSCDNAVKWCVIVVVVVCSCGVKSVRSSVLCTRSIISEFWDPPIRILTSVD